MIKLEEMSMLALLELKDEYRSRCGLYIENNIGERGTANYKTKEYFTCSFKKRVKHPLKKGQRWNASRSYQTFDTYREALIFCLDIAERVSYEMDKGLPKRYPVKEVTK